MLFILKQYTDVFNISASSSKLVCYYTSWSKYRVAGGKFTLSDVDPNLCTHLIFAFSGINVAHELVPYHGTDIGSYQTFNGLKTRSEFYPM